MVNFGNELCDVALAGENITNLKCLGLFCSLGNFFWLVYNDTGYIDIWVITLFMGLVIASLNWNLVTLHYRLRGSIGFLNVQKKSKSKRLFLTQGIPKSDNFALFVKILTQILYQKNFINFSESKYGQNHGQCSEKVERGLSGGWFLVWWQSRPCRE